MPGEPEPLSEVPRCAHLGPSCCMEADGVRTSVTSVPRQMVYVDVNTHPLGQVVGSPACRGSHLTSTTNAGSPQASLSSSVKWGKQRGGVCVHRRKAPGPGPGGQETPLSLRRSGCSLTSVYRPLSPRGTADSCFYNCVHHVPSGSQGGALGKAATPEHRGSQR